MGTTSNPLADCGLPRFFPLSAPPAGHPPVVLADDGIAVRFHGRSLAGMQKEAVVLTSVGGAWRLASDEGAYLHGLDEAPCPLAFMTAGMAASFMDAIGTRLAAAGVEHGGVRLVQDNYYTMRGSMPQRTMTGGAKAVELEVEIAVDRHRDGLRPLVLEAVAAAPVHAWLRAALRNTFTLTMNGRELSVPSPLCEGGAHPPDPQDVFETLVPPDTAGDALVVRAGMTPLTDEARSYTGSSYAPEQHRTLHLRGICTRRPDGVKIIEQRLYNPHGSIFLLLCDEARGHGGGGRAPDAATYISAGVGFCFMTQFGRFATIAGKRLDAYRIVQSTRFASGRADPVETHVFLDTPEDEAFAREVLAMGEQTCFLHALCREPIDVNVQVVTRRAGERLAETT